MSDEFHGEAIALSRYAGIALVLLCQGAALVYEAKHTGLTIDEPSHFAAGYAYWLGEDVLLPADTPALTRIVGGWVALVQGAPDLRQAKHWASRDAYMLGGEVLGSSRGRRLRFYSRLPFLVFPMGIVFLIWHWGRQLFSERTALLLALCAFVEPSLLGHGMLIKSDVAAAFSALLFSYVAWGYWRAPARRNLLLLTVTIIIALLTKFTLLPLVLVGYGLALWRGPRLLAAWLIPVAVYVGILASGQFQAQAIPAEKVAAIVGNSVPNSLLPAVQLLARLPWPTQFVDAIGYTLGNLRGAGFQGYLWGQKIKGWTPAYFPLVWTIKFPIALQGLALVAFAGFCRRLRLRRVAAAEVLIWGVALLLSGAAMASNFHIGIRHILPVFPLLILGGGYALDRLKPLLGVAVVLWLAASSLYVYPQGLSYFNEWIGGPKEGWKYLADSNVDWGQNYPQMAAYLNEHGIKDARAFLMSFDNPWHYIAEGNLRPQPWPAPGTKPGERYVPLRGTYVISTNLLGGLLMPPGYEDYLAEFRNLQPVARAGYSILIYQIE